MGKIQVSNEDGVFLVKQARFFVTSFLKNSNKLIPNEEFESKFSFPSGVFVTLNKNDSLRGCIGYPLPHTKLSNALKEAAIAAATDDPRFSPVDIDELDDITFEVTILTEPKIIKVERFEEYLDKIKIGQDGLIIKNGFNSGLLLPQVPIEYNWNVIQFLEHTCDKAGLEKNCWQKKDTEIQKFEGVIFSETMPNGEIVKQEL